MALWAFVRDWQFADGCVDFRQLVEVHDGCAAEKFFCPAFALTSVKWAVGFVDIRQWSDVARGFVRRFR
jgi:hypothetical protein